MILFSSKKTLAQSIIDNTLLCCEVEKNKGQKNKNQFCAPARRNRFIKTGGVIVSMCKGTGFLVIFREFYPKAQSFNYFYFAFMVL